MVVEGLLKPFDFAQDGLHLPGEPTVTPIEMIPAAGLGLAIAVKKCPICGQPVLSPERVLPEDCRTQGFGLCGGFEGKVQRLRKDPVVSPNDGNLFTASVKRTLNRALGMLARYFLWISRLSSPVMLLIISRIPM